jgi:predicted dehydrogenase
VTDAPDRRPAAGAGAGAGGKPVELAVIGLGYWGPNLVRNLYELPEANVRCVCDLRQEAVDRVVARFPAVRPETSVEAVLADPALEGVVIATPVSTHYELASAALDAGKHVLVEKPLAASRSEAADLAEQAMRARRVLMPGHTFLYSPAVNLTRTLIREGELGEIYFITTSRVNLGLHQPDVSVVWDLGPHDFSILRYWLDELPQRVSAVSRSCIFDGTPDVAFVSLEFPSRAIAHAELSWLAPGKLRRTAVVGSRKMLVYDDTSPEPVRVFDSGADLPEPESFGEYQLTYRTGDIVSPRVDASEPLSLELTDFVDAIRTGSTPRSSAPIGLDVVAITEAVDRSLAAGGEPVTLEPSAVPAI